MGWLAVASNLETRVILNQLDRYIGRVLLLATLVVLAAGLGLALIFGLIDEANTTREGFTFLHAVQVAVLVLPTRMYELAPFAVFIGVLVGLGSLSTSSEITVIRGTGVSVARIFVSAALPTLAVLVVSAAVGEIVAPASESLATSIRKGTDRETGELTLSRPYWFREGSVYSSVAAIDRTGALRDIRLLELNSAEELVSVLYAERAARDNETGEWVLEDVSRTTFADGETETAEIDSLVWETSVDPTSIGSRATVEPSKLSTVGLYRQVSDMRREGLNASRYEVALWMKVLQPLAVLGLLLTAVGFIIGPLREVGMGARLAVGVTVGVVFRYMQDLLGPMSRVYDVPSWVAVAAPIVLAWLIGFYLLRRAG